MLLAARRLPLPLGSSWQPHGAQYTTCRDDPLVFKDGFVETWRNGDPSGCVMRDASEDEAPFGTPGLNASSLAWVYEWE